MGTPDELREAAQRLRNAAELEKQTLKDQQDKRDASKQEAQDAYNKGDSAPGPEKTIEGYEQQMKETQEGIDGFLAQADQLEQLARDYE